MMTSAPCGGTMSGSRETPKIALPKGWKGHVRSAVLHAISVAQYATIYTWLGGRQLEPLSRLALRQGCSEASYIYCFSEPTLQRGSPSSSAHFQEKWTGYGPLSRKNGENSRTKLQNVLADSTAIELRRRTNPANPNEPARDKPRPTMPNQLYPSETKRRRLSRLGAARRAGRGWG